MRSNSPSVSPSAWCSGCSATELRRGAYRLPRMALVIAVETRTLGEAWLETGRRILAAGRDGSYDGLPMRELAHVSLAVSEPDPADATIAALADPAWLEWMHANFTEPHPVAELGDARSYGSRLGDYAGAGRDQLAWVVERLRAQPGSRSAAVTTFEPLLDTSYVPCVSLLDFWLPDGRVELVVYAHSLDFGKKAYGNLVELARLQERVAEALGAPIGRLLVHAKSAHVYDSEREAMAALAVAATT
jgi:thymidylate synthase